MDYPFTVPGYESIPLVLKTGMWAPKILHQGVPLQKTGARNYRLVFSDGSELPLSLKGGGFDMSVKVYHGTQEIPVVPPLPPWGYPLIYFPLVLIFVGGAIGGACGGAAAAGNAAILRSDMHIAAKVVLCLAVGLAAALAWLVVAVIFFGVLHSHPAS